MIAAIAAVQQPLRRLEAGGRQLDCTPPPSAETQHGSLAAGAAAGCIIAAATALLRLSSLQKLGIDSHCPTPTSAEAQHLKTAFSRGLVLPASRAHNDMVRC
jgi:hypothetical protein